jgi:hypothetical protein
MEEGEREGEKLKKKKKSGYNVGLYGGMKACEPDVPAVALSPQIHLAEDQEEEGVVMSRPALAGAA